MVRIKINRTFGFEIYFVVKTWRSFYRHFNFAFCNMRRPVSLAIIDEKFIAGLFPK